MVKLFLKNQILADNLDANWEASIMARSENMTGSSFVFPFSDTSAELYNSSAGTPDSNTPPIVEESRFSR